MSRLPAECAELRRVERVAAVVAGPVLDSAHERRICAQMLEDEPGQLDVLSFLAGADVVDGAGLALAHTSSIASQWSSTCSQSRTCRPSP